MKNLTMWIDGSFYSQNSPSASLLAHGLHYGTGVFEGIRCYPTRQGPAIFRLDAHMTRFAAGAQALSMPVDPYAMGQAALELLRRNDQQAAYIRPLSYYESGGLSLDVDQLKPRSVVATLPWTSHLGDAAQAVGVKLRTGSVRRTKADSVPPLKLCGNYVNSILAKLEATQADYDEALFTDEHGMVCEATGENVFMVNGDHITAVAHPDALPGITRATVMALTGAEERAVSVAELRQADEVFLTGTSAEVAWVSKLDGRTFERKRISLEVAQLYQDVVHGRSSTHTDWLTWA